MKRLMLGAAIAAISTLAACSKDATAPSASEDDYALVMFGQPGAALQGTLGEQGARGRFDGRTGMPHFPDSIALTDAQKTQIQALRDAFQAEHQATLDSLRAIFEAAKEARDGGATREEVRAILGEGRDIGEALHADVDALHEAILGVLTDEQAAWLAAHRPPPPSDVDGRRRPPGRPGRGGPPPNG